MGNKLNFTDILFYIFLFICVFTSNNWSYQPSLTQGEIFRFDTILLFGQINIYYLFAFIFFIVLLLSKYGNKNRIDIPKGNNFLKNIMWVYFIPVNMLIYLTIEIKAIEVNDLGVRPIMIFFVYLVVTYYVQDILFKKKDERQLRNALMILEILILFRVLYTIAKYHLGFGRYIELLGVVRIGQENDFADFFILLLIISLSSLLLEKNQKIGFKIIHIISIMTSSYIVIFSLRRYLWIEFIIVLLIVLLFYNAGYKNLHKKVIVISFTMVTLISLALFTESSRLEQNPYIGRLLSSLSMIDTKYESKYGTNTGHTDEILEGWENVKKHWILGVTPYGAKKLKRFNTDYQTDVYVHNAYLGIWLVYGFLSLVLFIVLFIKSLILGYKVYFYNGNIIGLMLFIFIICQLVKNIIWHTAITNINITVIYIFIISLVIKVEQLRHNHIS